MYDSNMTTISDANVGSPHKLSHTAHAATTSPCGSFRIKSTASFNVEAVSNKRIIVLFNSRNPSTLAPFTDTSATNCENSTPDRVLSIPSPRKRIRAARVMVLTSRGVSARVRRLPRANAAMAYDAARSTRSAMIWSKHARGRRRGVVNSAAPDRWVIHRRSGTSMATRGVH